MKKFRLFAILVLIFFISFNCFATKYKDKLKTELGIEGFVSVYHKINITTLTDTGGLGYGMPFDITDDEVQYNSLDQNLGRLIARWDFSSTISNVAITIKASPMTFKDNTSITLNYYISFKYKFALFNSDGSYKEDEVGYILTNSTDSDGESKNFNIAVEQDSFPIISSSQQDIRFMFMDGVDPTDATYPDGSYTATVTVTFTGE